MSTFSSSDNFFDFATQLNSQDVIQHALSCLDLQYRLIPNVILFTVWYAVVPHGRLLKNNILALQETVYAWHDQVFKPLQHLIKRLDRSEHQRASLIKQELKSEILLVEQAEQRFLKDTLLGLKKLKCLKRNEAQRLVDACHNFVNYCKATKTALNEEGQQAIKILLQTVFANLSSNEIDVALEYAINHARLNTQIYQLAFRDF